MKKVGLILCRAGSKGVPGKNKKILNSLPMFVHQVQNLKSAGVTEVYVSTDDADIKAMATKYDFIPVDRPPHMCQDKSKCEEALKHFSSKIEYDILVFAQATSPMCPPKFIQKGIDLVESGKCDSAVSVVEEHWLPRWTTDMIPVNWSTEKRPRRQDREVLYVENGAFYITKRESFDKTGIRYSGKILPVVMPLIDSFQVDTEDDLELITNLMRINNSDHI